MDRPSPLQNRVTPFGEIIASPERGRFMGNRGGCFHDDRWQLTHRASTDNATIPVVFACFRAFPAQNSCT